MAKKVTGELYESLTGQLFEIGRQLRQKNGYPFNPEILHRHLQKAIEGRFDADAETASWKKNEFLHLISCGENLIIDNCDGSEILADASDVFTWIDSDLRNWDADEKGQATENIPVQVYELEKDGKYPQIYSAHSSDLDMLCLTQHQIKKFVQKYQNWLQTDGYATFFLFKSNSYYFVAFVYFRSHGRLGVGVYRPGYGHTWDAGNRHRFVLPQLDI